MTNQEILNKAIEKAIDNAWEFDNLDKWRWSAIRKTDTVMNNWYYFLITYDGKEKLVDAERIIYDHDFAKALWGADAEFVGERYYENGGISDTIRLPKYLYHLQQMVIAEDPVAYLGAHLPQ